MRSLFYLLLGISLLGCQQKPTPKPKPKVDVTVVVYTATWCGPCQQAKPKLAKLRQVGVKIHEIDCSNQFPKGIESVPHYVVYDAQGNIVGEAKSITALIAILKLLGVILPLLL